jgi:hypothetical protein
MEFDGHSWVEVDSAGPPARQLMSMAFDESRGRAVVFGGTGANRVKLDDTWEWTARTGSASSMGRQRFTAPPHTTLIVFGGIEGQGMSLEERGHSKLNDLWSYSGTAWHKLDQ